MTTYKQMPIRSMIALTFRELWANQIIFGIIIVSTLSWLMLVFALNLDIVEGSLVSLRLFGQDTGMTDTIRNQNTGEVIRQALTLQQVTILIEQFAAGAAYWVGTLLGLFSTAPILAGLLQRGQVDLLLSKPVSRTRFLVGHVLGVWSMAFLIIVYLLGMVWLVISLKTGIWNTHFFLTVMVVMCMFAVMYSVVTLLVVSTQSTALSLIVTYGLIFCSVILAFKESLVPQINRPWREVFLGFYHILPKFAEVTSIVAKLAGAEPVDAWYSFVSSTAFGLILYIGAIIWINRRDF